MEIICHDALHMDEIHVYARPCPGQIAKITVSLEECSETMISYPSARIRRHEAQQLMNELWRIGLRPRDGRGSLADMSHVEAHLEDMRKIAFKFLEDKND